MIGPGLALFDSGGVFLGEQMIVQTDFGTDCVRGRYPVNRSFDLASVRRRATFGFRIVSAVNLDDVARLFVPHEVRTGNEITISQADFTTGR